MPATPLLPEAQRNSLRDLSLRDSDALICVTHGEVLLRRGYARRCGSALRVTPMGHGYLVLELTRASWFSVAPHLAAEGK